MQMFYLYREYTDKILLSPLSPLYILHQCSLHVGLFTFILLFSFPFLFSLFFYYHYFLYHPNILLCYVILCMPFFHRHSPLIDCKIVIRDGTYFHSHYSPIKSDVNYSANFFYSSGPHILKPCTKNCDTSRITWTVTPLPLMVILVTAAPCLNKDIHINCYKKET